MPGPRSMTSIARTSARIEPATTTSWPPDASWALVMSERKAWLTARDGRRTAVVAASPSWRTTLGSVRAPVSVYKAIAEDGSQAKAVKDVATAVSIATGLPAMAIARPLSYVAGVEQGKVSPTGPVDAVRGTVTGVASPESRNR